jgi:hypothetical protein
MNITSPASIRLSYFSNKISGEDMHFQQLAVNKSLVKEQIHESDTNAQIKHVF